MKKTCYFLLIVFFLKSITTVRSQDTSFYFSGVVIDKMSGKNISDAQIKVCGSYRSVLTKSNGSFSILIRKQAEVIEFSAPGYKPKFLSTPMILNPESKILLEQYNVSGTSKNEASETILRNGKWKIKQLSFIRNKLILQCTNLNLNKDALLLLDNKNNICDIKYVGDVLTGFSQTSDGQDIALGEQKAFSIKVIANEIFSSETELIQFERKNYSTTFRDSSGKYIRYQSGYDFYISTESKLMARRTYLTYHVRMKKTNRLSLFKNYGDEAFTNSSGNWKKTSDCMGFKEAPHSNGEITFHEVPWQIIQTKNNLLFFDTENSKVEIFDSIGRLTKTTAYFYGKRDIIQQKIIYDKTKDKFYHCSITNSDLSEEKNLVTKLIEIDVQSGTGTKILELDPSVFNSIIVENGFLYFINNRQSSNSLARKKID